ncbi:DUF7919 family protein [Streptomyces purpurogeneiscleroticus]|uniref:DUF7919 family protein n=1 Tax=Streptomyces purpurogeneiscleroticus TaxID=68259 RepID=UPI001CC0D4BA|nr:hypothetical protein [Streptomyces purpurogeneiscleroticus]
MTYYPDLSIYTYSESDNPMLNVGWLSRDHEYRKGEAPEGLIKALAKLAKESVNVQRGMHFCELCPSFQVARENTSWHDIFIGSGEIHVASPQGTAYAAPAMIVHYVDSHAYLPPEDFCNAALQALRQDS